jgi:putative transposase
MPTTATPSRRLHEELRAATLESRLEELEALGVLRSFSRPRVSNDNPYSESLFRTVKHRPYYSRRPFRSVHEASASVAVFLDWYNHLHRHSGDAVVISRHLARVYELALQRHPRRWSRSTRFWRQPEVVWINLPPPEDGGNAATLVMAA